MDYIGLNILREGLLPLILSLLVLSTLYCYFGFALFNNIRLKEIFKKDRHTEISVLRIIGAVFSGMILSTYVIGILFKLQYLFKNARESQNPSILGDGPYTCKTKASQ